MQEEQCFDELGFYLEVWMNKLDDVGRVVLQHYDHVDGHDLLLTTEGMSHEGSHEFTYRRIERP